MKYYVVSDVHGFYTPLVEALTEAGFFKEAEPHKLIVCGDMMDRGREAVKMQEFMLKLLEEDKLIFVKGNHEELLETMLRDLKESRWEFEWGYSYHISNGTWGTALQLTGFTDGDATRRYQDFIEKVKNTDFYTKLIPASVDWYETPNYIFVHGWIPCTKVGKKYIFNPDWRNSNSVQRHTARWENGMQLAEEFNIVEPNKKIVCGHWHASFGHCAYEKKGSEFGKTADFTPYYGNGVIAIDRCTAHTGKVNVLIVED